MDWQAKTLASLRAWGPSGIAIFRLPPQPMVYQMRWDLSYKGIHSATNQNMDPLPLRFAPAGDDNGTLTRSQNGTIRAMMNVMKMSCAILAASLAAATPALAIQEVVLGPRAPAFAAASSMGLAGSASRHRLSRAARLNAIRVCGPSRAAPPRNWARSCSTPHPVRHGP